MTIQTIINNALKRLKLEGKLLTPDFYAEAFCKEARRANMHVEDCGHLSKFTTTLNKEFQKELKNYNIHTMHELVRFLISKLNRTNPTQCSDTLEAEILLTKRILQAVEVLHNQEATALAKSSIELIESGAKPEELNSFRQRWVNFLTTYDDTFLLKLKKFGDVDTNNLRKTIENINIESASTQDNASLESVAKLLIASFVPSIASSVNDTIASLSEKIKKHPELLESQSVAEEIKKAITLRIALDKESVEEMIKSIDGVLDKLSLRLIDMIEKSDGSNKEIQGVKKELESYTEDGTKNFQLTHKKLYTIATVLEENTQLLSKDLKNHNSEITLLSQKVKKLEKELETVKRESKEDFLTKLPNRRSLDDFLLVKEAEYKRHERNYSVVMFDIDKFKNVNDTYGHDAGDVILSALASILKKACRTEDVVGRFGGEEFLAILSNTETQGAVTFAEKIRVRVEKARFIYKGERVKVTISSGVAERSKHISQDATINSADEYLYVAKTHGRNQVGYNKS